jgi:hypothetical protein
MVKIVSIFGILLAVGFVVLALGAGPEAQVERPLNPILHDGCSLQDVPLDEGYGVTRKVVQRVCGGAPQD